MFDAESESATELAGQVTRGGVVSTTVTAKENVTELLAASFAVQLADVIPREKDVDVVVQTVGTTPLTLSVALGGTQ